MQHLSEQSSVVKYKMVLIFLLGILVLIASFIASLSIGAYAISFADVLKLLFSPDEGKAASIIHTIRLPRALVGIIVGACLAIAGGIMQAITNNPLASPQVFGVNAGASLMVVAGVVLFPGLGSSTLVYFAFLGAAVGGAIVYSLSSTGGGMTPVKLALAGITVHLFLSSLIEGIVLFHETSTEDVLFWLAGGIDGRNWADVRLMIPWSLTGLIGALFLGKGLTILGLGDDVARGLGQKIGWIRASSAILVILLAGISVAVAGPIGFIGLIIPNIVRKLMGSDYRLVLPLSAVFGAALLTISDVLSRFISFPAESPVGIVTALLGAPFFLYLASKGGRAA
ncbi:iron complex transport system permease protein [Halobacillus aidingensis]|uniref:Iron complex transport system permease protein n=2 Tax=Bacillaceae TaxID=186817 RepID=A0A1H0QZT6_HALAD|nr:iron complex transport system permease protein [Halobacillus aidingensis]